MKPCSRPLKKVSGSRSSWRKSLRCLRVATKRFLLDCWSLSNCRLCSPCEVEVTVLLTFMRNYCNLVGWGPVIFFQTAQYNAATLYLICIGVLNIWIVELERTWTGRLLQSVGAESVNLAIRKRFFLFEAQVYSIVSNAENKTLALILGCLCQSEYICYTTSSSLLTCSLSMSAMIRMMAHTPVAQ